MEKLQVKTIVKVFSEGFLSVRLSLSIVLIWQTIP